MKNFKIRSEKGQSLIFMVFGMVALLGFTALAVDGGMLYSDRRHTQNSADAASLAGGGAAALYLENHHVNYSGWSCGSSGVLSAMNLAKSTAITHAASNDYAIDADISDDNGVDANCNVHDNGSWVEKYIDIKTIVTSETKSAFAHFVFGDELKNTVIAVTRVKPPTGLAFGYAVAALREDCPNTNTGGVHFDGNSSISVYGGGIFSNACMVKSGGVSVGVSGSPITCTGSGCWTDNGGSGSVSPTPREGDKPLPPEMYEVPPPDCNSVPSRGSHNGGGTIPPGRYTTIRVTTPSANLVLEPGLYCISGGITINGGTVIGNGVTIYMQSGSFSSSGNASIQLAAPPGQGCTICPPAIPGILIYSAEGNTSDITLTGTSDSQYIGVVFAPSGTIDAGGSSSEISEIHAQLIGDTVKLHGTTDVVITYNDDQMYHLNSMLELFR